MEKIDRNRIEKVEWMKNKEVKFLRYVEKKNQWRKDKTCKNLKWKILK